MPIGPDVLATALQEHLPGLSELFLSWHPLLEKIITGGKVRRTSSGGPYHDFTVVTGGPGDVTTVEYGSEHISGGRSQKGQRGTEYAARMIYAFDVPGKDLAEANGKTDLARLLEEYPELAMGDFQERIAQQLASGNGTNVGGFMTWNGLTTYSTNGSTRTGFFESAATGSQSSTTHNLSSSTVTGWVNQYEDITSFAGNGRSQLRKAYYAANRQGKELKGKIDCVFADESTFLNYVDDLDGMVRLVNTNTGASGDQSPDASRESVKFLGTSADLYLEEAITLAQYSGDDADGVAFGINSKTWEMLSYGHNAAMETKGFFDSRGPWKIPTEDQWRYEIIFHSQLICRSKRNNFYVTGGGTA